MGSKLKSFCFIFSIVLIATALILQTYLHKRENDFIRITVFAKKTLHEEEKTANKFVEWIGELLSRQTNFANVGDSLFKNADKPKSSFYYFVYHHDSLIYWDNNSVNVSFEQVKSGVNQQLILLKNGWYEIFRYERRSITIIGLLPIKTNYTYQNKYLVNEFNPILNLPEHAQLLESTAPGSYPVLSSNGNYLFSIKYNPIMGDPGRQWPLALLYLSGFLLAIFTLYLFASAWLHKNALIAFGIISVTVLIKWFMLEFKQPRLLYGMPLFNPKFYATSYFLNSLGDFLLSVSVFCSIIIFAYQYLYLRKNKIHNIRQSSFLLSLSVVANLLFTFIFSVFINYLISGLILNSKISFNVNNVFELTFFSLVGFLIIGILLYTFYITCEGTVRFVQYGGFGMSYNILLFLLTQGLFLIILILFRETEIFINYGVSTFLLTNSLILFISYIRFTSKRDFSFVRYMLVIAGFSMYAAQTISYFNQMREKDNMRLLVNKVENREDLIAEYLFQDVEQKIKNDNFLSAFFTSGNGSALEEKVKKRIALLYFNQVYWSRYDIHVRAFDSSGISLFNPVDSNITLRQFDSIITNQARSTYSNSFHYVNSTSGKIAYLGKINFINKSESNRLVGTLIIELDSRFFQEEGGFPDLLLSDKLPVTKDISNYSYAKYQDNKLVLQNGKFNYYMTPITYEKFYGPLHTEQFVTFSGYTHLFTFLDKNNLIIISNKNPVFLEQLTLFSYVFIFFSATFSLLYIVWLLVISDFKLQLDFRKRIQLSVIGMVIIAIILIGSGSIFYITRGYSEQQKVRIKERLTSLMLGVENEVNDKIVLEGKISDESALAFSRISNTLGTDFNLYDKSGRLLFSTQPKIFEQEIVSRLMNRKALDQLGNYQSSGFIHDEKIGKLDFTSAYEIIRNNENKITGYLNLPYFAHQNELKKEISGFLVALINIYVLLFGVAIVLTFIISNRLVKPLNLIQEKLGKVKLGSSNEFIDWEAKDEIGSLVNEYNKMVIKISESAEVLAQSEREMAWREMAKQVAHEIKNPLTPMKLSVQHLFRAWNEKSENLDAIIKRVTETMIEQIDSLSRIATEFSNFAKMPKGNFERLDLAKSLQSNIDLYGEDAHVALIFKNQLTEEAWVKGDREQTLRAFSNLIKNAMQSVPENKNGQVVVTLSKNDQTFVVLIADNGSGIPTEVKSKIFTPNFTTKSSGTGLGLAMVKSIIENMQGEISFSSEVGKGTTFVVQIPFYQEDLTAVS